MNGFLNINKPAGWTSHDVVAKIRRLLKIDKVGHTGTLDPAATGVLPICLGKATKVSRFLMATDKQYRVVLRLGQSTDTQDATGAVLSRRPVGHLTEREIFEAVLSFQGEITQVVPMYSAVKVDGERLYKSARRNKQVEQPSRKVMIQEIRPLAIRMHPGGEAADVTFEVTASKGTYVRTLCQDIGERLGVGGHLFSLERRVSGPFRIEDSYTIEQIAQRAEAGTVGEVVVPIDKALSSYASLRVTQKASSRVIHGGKIFGHEVASATGRYRTGETLLVYNPLNQLIALASAVTGSDGINGAHRDGSLFKVDKVLV